MARHCAHCDCTYEDNARFCMLCGQRLSAEPLTKLLDNRYEITDTIKSGPRGTLFKARDIRMGTFVAIKKMISTFSSGDDEAMALQRFWEKARRLAAFTHRGLPRVTNFFTAWDPESSKDACYLVMDFIEGKDLEHFIKAREGTLLSPQEAVDLFKQALSILAYLHNQSPPFLIPDLNPSHLMMADDRVFIISFGVSESLAPPAEKPPASGYVAPEQRRGILEARGNLYSLAMIMQFLLTGGTSGSPVAIVDEESSRIMGLLTPVLAAMKESDIEKRPPSAEAVFRKLYHTAPKPSDTYEDASSEGSSPPSTAEMLTAIRYRNFPVMEAYIEKGGDMNAISYRGSTLLHAATEKGDPETLELFLTGSVDINYAGKIGWTALHLATITGDVKIGKILIDHKANVNAVNDEGTTPLHRVIHWGHEEFIRLLIKNGADTDKQDKHGMTALHYAVAKNKENLVRTLISNGANPNLADETGSTPLHIAAEQDFQGTMKLLILGGADVNIKNKAGLTALHMISQKSYGVTADLLIAKGADINARDNREQTPLHLAASTDFSMVSFLLSHGADFKSRDLRGATPLQRAISAGKRESVALLRKYGA